MLILCSHDAILKLEIADEMHLLLQVEFKMQFNQHDPEHIHGNFVVIELLKRTLIYFFRTKYS